MKKNIKSYGAMTLGCVLYALAFDWFFAPNDLTCGGFTGIAQIINFFAPFLSVGVMLIVLNVPLYLIGFKRFGFSFLVKSLFAMAVSSVLVDAVAAVHTFHGMDKLLAGLYGGVILGVGCGLIMREGATTGGTELASWIVKQRVPHLSIGNVLLGLDLTVIILYALAFKNLNNALYGALSLFVTTKVVDLIVYGGNTGKLAYIISSKETEITQKLLDMGLGLTKLNAMGAYTETERPILLCAVRRREIVMVKRLVKGIDPSAFFILCDASEVLGEGFGDYNPNGLQ